MTLDSRTRMSIALLSIAAWLTLTGTSVLAQRGRGGFGLDPRAEDRAYRFEDTDEDLP